MKRKSVRYFADCGGGTARVPTRIPWAAGSSRARCVQASDGGRSAASTILEKGDAPAPVRAEVLQALRRFQDGYIRRDPAQLEGFMRGLFPEGAPVVVLGTNSSEWVGGYRAVSRFIRSDWLNWGDVRLKVEDAVVSSQGRCGLGGDGRSSGPGERARGPCALLRC